MAVPHCAKPRVYGSPVDWITTASFWTAFGTVGAVVLALSFQLFGALRRWHGRPVLELSTGRTGPWTRRATVSGSGESAVFLRLKVENAGRSMAQQVGVRVHRWWIKEPGADWSEHDIDPAWLHPVSTAADPTLQGPMLDIPSGSHDYYDVAAYFPVKDRIVLEVHDPRPRGVSWTTSTTEANQRVELAVHSENADLKTTILEFEFDKKVGAKLALLGQIDTNRPADGTAC